MNLSNVVGLVIGFGLVFIILHFSGLAVFSFNSVEDSDLECEENVDKAIEWGRHGNCTEWAEEHDELVPCDPCCASTCEVLCDYYAEAHNLSNFTCCCPPS